MSAICASPSELSSRTRA
jgi:integrase